jgi:hypothetical protein
MKLPYYKKVQPTLQEEKLVVKPGPGGEMAIPRLPTTDCEFYRNLVADCIDTLRHNSPNLKHNRHPESHTMKSIQTKLKNNHAMATVADKGNSLVILTIQQYESKIQNFLLENFQTSTIGPTKTFQSQIRAINASTALIPRASKWKYINLNPSPPSIKGLIKIQPIRPVVNWRNAPAYKLARLFRQKINQLTPLPYSFNIKNTKDLILNLKDNKYCSISHYHP